MASNIVNFPPQEEALRFIEWRYPVPQEPHFWLYILAIILLIADCVVSVLLLKGHFSNRIYWLITITIWAIEILVIKGILNMYEREAKEYFAMLRKRNQAFHKWIANPDSLFVEMNENYGRY